MLIPQDFYTEERIQEDLNILKIYYDMCKELDLTKEENVKVAFNRLKKLAGKPIFFKESIFLSSYIQKKKRHIQNIREEEYYEEEE